MAIELTSSTTWQEDTTARWNEWARTSFLKYVPVYRMGVRNEAKGCVTVGFPKSLLEQTVEEMVANGMEVVGA